jgi:hypothetical protein
MQEHGPVCVTRSLPSCTHAVVAMFAPSGVAGWSRWWIYMPPSASTAAFAWFRRDVIVCSGAVDAMDPVDGAWVLFHAR